MSEFSSSLVPGTIAILHRLQIARPHLTYKIGELLYALDAGDGEFPVKWRLAELYLDIAGREAHQALADELELLLVGWILAGRAGLEGISVELLSFLFPHGQKPDR